MIASLPMYDWPLIRPQTDRFWALIRDGLRAQGIDAPDTLDHDHDLWEGWLSPNLLLGQTCGLPYRSRLHDVVHLVGTLDYALPDAPAGHYYSQLIVHRDTPGSLADFAGKHLACNGHDSQSGWAAPLNHAAGLGFAFGKISITGAHRESARAVAEGRADIAAVDGVTWRLILTHMPEVAAKLRPLGHTAPTPGLPLITRHDPAPLRAAVTQAITALAPGDRAALGLRGLALIPEAAYLAVPTPEQTAHLAGEITQNA